MVKSVDEGKLSIAELIDPESMPLETLVYKKALMVQHYRIEKIASNALGSSPLVIKENLNGLYGAIYTMVMNLVDDAGKDYGKFADAFESFDINEYPDDVSELNSGFKKIMKMHKRNIKEYRRLGLLPAKDVTMYAVPEAENENLLNELEV